ncbi:MAG: hypothetical protein FJY98_01245 [Candidatus Liptonbacteria bacterium]|nr:hypothetical protein [Candidatus Liptonbacteria bacterium]
MASDLQSLRASGGVRPKSERIVLSKPAENEQPRISWLASKNIEVKWLFVAGGAILMLGALLVYGFNRFSVPFPFGGGLSGAVATSTAAEEELAFATSSVPQERPSLQKGIFRKPLDRSASFIAAQVAQNITELKTPVQRLREALEALPAPSASSTLVEMLPIGESGEPVSLSEYFTLLDLDVFNSGFLATHFEGRFGMFVYRDKKGWWPGYVLALKPGENWLFLKEEMAALEESPNLSNFFLTAPGSPKSNFLDARIGDVSAREILWADGRFIYGWFRGYLVLSTSQAGLEAVLPRL